MCGHHTSNKQIGHRPDIVANPARDQLNRDLFSLLPVVPENLAGVPVESS